MDAPRNRPVVGGGGGGERKGEGHKAIASEALAFLFCFKGYFTQSRSESKATILLNILCVCVDILYTIKPVILFAIYGNYLFLHIWDFLNKTGKILC